MSVPITTYLNIARICQYLAADGSNKKLLFQGGGNRPDQGHLLYMVRQAVQWLFDIDPTNGALPLQANYMYSLCNPYIPEAQSIINSGSSGSIVNPNTGQNVTVATPNPQFRVGNPGALMLAGETTLTLNYAGVVPASLEITLDGSEVPYGDPAMFSFTATYNPSNVEVVFNQQVQNNWYLNFHMIQLITV